MYQIEINQHSGEEVKRGWIKKIVRFTLRKVDVKAAEISAAFVGDEKIKALNKRYRGKNKITDVLSFTYQIQDTRYKIPLIGEIIISYPQAARQAKKRGHSVNDEIKILLVHGVLHLCGYDHEKSEKEAKKMEELQLQLVNILK